MHNIDIEVVEMSLDIIKYAIGRVTSTTPKLGFPKSEAELDKLAGETITAKGIGGETAFKIFRDVLLESSVSIDHPRHLAFIPASPTRAGIMFDLVTAASSIHGAYWMEGAGGIWAENQAMKWLVSLTGLPEGAFGVFTSGGTTANLSAIVAARGAWREKNPANERVRGLIITSAGAHSSLKSMAKVIDADMISIEIDDRFEAGHLAEALTSLSVEDRARTFAVIATAGTTNSGVVDDLKGLGKIANENDLWFHIDAAYGGGALAAPSVRHMFEGIELADSITIDPHKWFFSPYDCGAVIYRNPEQAKSVHSQAAAYLEIAKGETAGFNPADYQIQLTRRLRGLPLWFSLAMHGTDRYTEAIERGIELAQIAGRIITETPHVELIREPSLSCVLFRRIGWSPQEYTDWTYRNHKSGYALITPTKWHTRSGNETVARFCFINPDTTEDDIRGILATME